MHLFNLSTTLLGAALLAHGIIACSPSVNASDAFQLGNDGPADAATLGYNVNHFALNVNDLDASMHFYGEILGMRHIFTYEISPTLELVYMGHSTGGKNGTGFQTGEELYKQYHNTAGLIELLHRKRCSIGNDSDASKPWPASTSRTNTFGHVGLIVPDIMATQRRMQNFGVPILKPVGEDPDISGPIANAFGVGDVAEQEAREIIAGLRGIGFQYALVVEDPDGNLVEILPQDG